MRSIKCWLSPRAVVVSVRVLWAEHYHICADSVYVFGLVTVSLFFTVIECCRWFELLLLVVLYPHVPHLWYWCVELCDASADRLRCKCTLSVVRSAVNNNKIVNWCGRTAVSAELRIFMIRAIPSSGTKHPHNGPFNVSFGADFIYYKLAVFSVLLFVVLAYSVTVLRIARIRLSPCVSRARVYGDSYEFIWLVDVLVYARSVKMRKYQTPQQERRATAERFAINDLCCKAWDLLFEIGHAQRTQNGVYCLNISL